MWNPFRSSRVREAAESRDLDVGSVSWPVEPLASPSAMSVDGALRLAPVFAAGRLLASKIAGLPLYAYRRSSGRSQQLPLPELFESPSAQGVYYHWIFRAVTSLAYRGNAVGVVTQRDRMEFPTRIEWLNPADVRVEDSLPLGQSGSFTDPRWYYLGERVPTEDIVHIPWFTLPGRVWGLSPLGAYAVTVSTGLSAQKFSDDWYRSGGVPPGQFRNAEKKVDQREAGIIKQRLLAAIRSHEPIVYGADWEYTPITVSPNEAKFVETMRLTATQIAAIYGIPPEMIGGETGGSMSYSSPEQRQLELTQFSLDPWLSLLEAHLTPLVPRGVDLQFNSDAMIRPDVQTRYDSHRTARLIGLKNLDEIRAEEGLPPLPGGAGRDYTPLPIQAGVPVGMPQAARSNDEGRLRLIRPDEGMNHG